MKTFHDFADAVADNRRGVVLFTEEVPHQMPDALNAVQALIMVVRCEYMMIDRQYVMHAYSPHFEAAHPGAHTPVYKPIISIERDDDGNVVKLDVAFEKTSQGYGL